jgi:3-isopropylmalate dehydrogenase
MTRRTTYVLACLSGHGIGPEVMAEASRALARVSRLHGFRIEETHPPFGAEAVTQSGHALPPSTRKATLSADAILVASAHESALTGVESELDLRARLDRVAFGHQKTVTIVSPLSDDAREWTFQRAFDIACSSRAHVLSVAGDERWTAAFRAEATRRDVVRASELPVGRAAHDLVFAPEGFDVVVAPAPVGEALVALAACQHRPRVLASGRLAADGPGLFAPVHGPAAEIAGQGVANPASMLLAASLMLAEGLGERRAAESLSGAVVEACSNGARTTDMLESGLGSTTREFGEVVLAALPHSMTTAEFYREAVA